MTEEHGDVAGGLVVVVRHGGCVCRHVQLFGCVAQDAAEVVHVHEVVVVRQWSESQAVGSDDLGGDALPDSAGVLPVSEQRGIGVGMHVDEAGRNGQAGGVDDACGVCGRVRSPIADTRLPSMPTSAGMPGAPVPS